MAEVTRKLLLDALVDMAAQHFHWDEDGVADTMALTANAFAMEVLVKVGVMEYVGEGIGRRWFGKWTKTFLERGMDAADWTALANDLRHTCAENGPSGCSACQGLEENDA